MLLLFKSKLQNHKDSTFSLNIYFIAFYTHDILSTHFKNILIIVEAIYRYLKCFYSVYNINLSSNHLSYFVVI